MELPNFRRSNGDLCDLAKKRGHIGCYANVVVQLHNKHYIGFIMLINLRLVPKVMSPAHTQKEKWSILDLKNAIGPHFTHPPKIPLIPL